MREGLPAEGDEGELLMGYRGYRAFSLIIGAVLFFASCGCHAAAGADPRIELKGTDFYINGEKFLIIAVGYSPYRPGMSPGGPMEAAIPADVIEEDFRRIREAGFNAIRVWSSLPSEYIKIAERYGLKVIQAVGLSPNTDFAYSGFRRQAAAWTREMCRESRVHRNVIMYMLMNEPHPETVLESGIPETVSFYKDLIDVVKSEDPLRPASMANAYWTLWLDQTMWNPVSFNAYEYYPGLIRDIGYQNYINELRRIHAPGKCFLVTEFGYSVSPAGAGSFGYGGNSPEEQADGLVRNFREILSSGAIGCCVFEWNDEWWKAKEPGVHGDHAEEWFGILGIEGRGRSCEVLRPSYYHIKEETEMIVTSPADGARVSGRMDLEVNARDDIVSVSCAVDGGAPAELARGGAWWRKSVDVSALAPGRHLLAVTGKRKAGGGDAGRNVYFINCANPADTAPRVKVDVSADKESYENGDKMFLKAVVTDGNGAPLPEMPVVMGVSDDSDGYLRRWAGVTDSSGLFERTAVVRGAGKQWFYTYWAGAESGSEGVNKRYGRLGFSPAYIGKGYPVQWVYAAAAGIPVRIDGALGEAWAGAGRIMIDPDNCFVDGDIGDSADLSADIRLIWDESGLYLFADVRDDVPSVNGYRGKDIWKGDSIEVFVSVDPGKIPERGYSPHDFQIIIGSNGEAWIYDQAKGGKRGRAPVKSEIAALRSGNGYKIEARLSTENFYDGGTGRLSSGKVMGLDVAVGDADGPEGRKGKIVWNGLKDGYVNSALWGRMKLL